nr:hypothetical protein [Cronobacter sakazakii]
MRHGIRAISGKARLRLFFQQSFFAAFQPRYCLLRASAEAISMQNVAACFFAALFIFLELYFAIPAPVIQGAAKRAGVLPQVLKRARHFTFKKVKAC